MTSELQTTTASTLTNQAADYRYEAMSNILSFVPRDPRQDRVKQRTEAVFPGSSDDILTEVIPEAQDHEPYVYIADGNRQAVSDIEQSLVQPDGDVTNIIPFPTTRTSRNQPKDTRPGRSSLSLIKFLVKIISRVMRPTRYTNDSNNRKQSSTGDDTELHQALIRDQGGRSGSTRISG